MKINITPIVRDHFASLRHEHNQKPSIADYAIFFCLPLLTLYYVVRIDLRLDRDSYNASITFFGIFIALLLNIQVAIFSIYQRKWQKNDEPIYDTLVNSDMETRRRLLEQLNSNVSYLILVCCLALVVALVSYVFKMGTPLMSGLTVALYAHFLLTMLMIVKRAHALFQREYQERT